MKIIVIGYAGMLGREIAESFVDDGFEVIGIKSSQLDITDGDQVFEILDNFQNADYLINCAAFTDVDGCQYEVDKAFSVNGDGVRYLARWAANNDVTMIHFSTDYVFDGTKQAPYLESDEPSPINVYGESKRIGELGVLAECEKFYIFRVQWLFGDYGHHFIQTILKLCQTQDTLKIVNDQWGSPTWTLEIARCLSEFISLEPPFKAPYGIYNFHNTGYTTWFDYAKHIILTLGLPNKVKPVTSDTYLRPAKRPENGQLDMSKYLSLRVTSPISWEEATTDYITKILLKKERIIV